MVRDIVGSEVCNALDFLMNVAAVMLWIMAVFPIIFLFCVLLVTVCKLLIERKEAK